MQNLQDAVVQVGIVLLISWIVFFISKRKIKGFYKWIGLYIPNTSNFFRNGFKWLAIAIGLSLIPILLIIQVDMSTDVTLAYKSIEGGRFFLIGLFLKTLIQTGLSEELLFRGLIGKRLIYIFGYKTGNRIQALIFGAIHFFAIITFGILVGGIMMVMIVLTGYFYGYIMHKKSNGSILLCWLIHGLSNFLSFGIFYLVL